MKKQSILAWMKKNAQQIQLDYGLEDWEIDYNIENCVKEEGEDGDTQAEITSALFEYKKASITFYSDHIMNLKELKKVLRHELYHIILSPFSMWYNSLIDTKTLTSNDMHRDYMIKCEELVVHALEKKDRYSK